MTIESITGELPDEALRDLDLREWREDEVGTYVGLLDARDGSPLAQAAAPGNGQEQKLTKELIRELPDGSLEGKTVKGDALYSNKDLVREIVQQRGGEVLVQLKANQKTTLEEVTRRLSHTAPPFWIHLPS